MSARWIVIDIDALADNSHRIDFRAAGEWEEFNSRCVNDAVHQDVAELIRQNLFCTLVVCSRSPKYAQPTMAWLSKNGIAPDDVAFKEGDFEKDHLEFVRAIEQFFNKKNEALASVWFVLTNRDKPAAALREYGFNVWRSRP